MFLRDCDKLILMKKEDGPPAGSRKELFIPLIFSAAVIILDQLTKQLVVANIPAWSVGAEFFGGAFRIIHVYNPGAAFSLGSGLSRSLRGIVFGLLPVAVLAVILRVYFRNREFTRLQRWCIAGIVGGGAGNLIDRFFRPEGVVDFLDVRVYGFLGFERWPTFNLADSAIVVCGIVIICSFIRQFLAEAKENRNAGKTDKTE